MPYDVTLVQFDGSAGGFVSTVAQFGFPAGSFTNLLFSYWMCIPQNPTTGNAGTIGSAALWMGCGPSAGINFPVSLRNTQTGTALFSGTFGPVDVRDVRSHCLLSVNTSTQTVQLYVNDKPMSLLSGGWTGSGPLAIDTGPFGQFKFDIGSLGGYPACADVWSSAPGSFVDLSVTANRRKFINGDLSPVDLGATGSNPFGTQPPIWLTVPSGGVATDFLHNYGTGGAMILQGVGPPSISLQAPGVCHLPPPPPGLAMDDLSLLTIPTPGCEVYLSWSDDRGHNYGNWVGQRMGARGEYRANLKWQRLGYARDRMFRMEWSCPAKTVLKGAFIEMNTAAKT